MRRLAIGGLVGIAALFLLSAALLERLARVDGEPAPPTGRAGPPAPARPFDPALPTGWRPGQPLDPARAGAPSPADFDAMADRGPPRVAPPPGSWEAVPVHSGRARAGDGSVAAVMRELNDLHEELATCFDPAVAVRFGRGAVTEAGPGEAEDDLGVTTFLLQLELRTGAALVVDAPVQARGGAGDETLACVQAKLRGRLFAAPGARGGERRRLQYKLIP